MDSTQIKYVVREAVVRELSQEQIDNREAEFVISTEAVDSYGTVFKASGWDLTRYQQNPIVVYGHKVNSDNPDMILGTSEVRLENNQLLAKVRFESQDVNPLAEKVWQKVKSGTLRMASIGANIEEWRWGDTTVGENNDVVYFTRQQLLEWSIVPLGSNPDALVRERSFVEQLRSEKLNNIPVTDAENVSETEKRKLSFREAQLVINKNKEK